MFQETDLSTDASLRENLESTSIDLKVNLENIKVATEKAWNHLQEVSPNPHFQRNHDQAVFLGIVECFYVFASQLIVS